jgi:hypothetical protein
MDALAIASESTLSARAQLRAIIARGLRRLRMQAALDAAFAAVLVSLVSLCVLIFLDRLLSLRQIGLDIRVLWGAVTALGLPYVLWRVYSPGLQQMLAAVLADERLGLHSRLSSALTLDLDDPATAKFSAAFFAEALQSMRSLDIQKAFPIRAPRHLPLPLLPLVACLGLFFLMPYQDRLGLAAAKETRRRQAVLAENISRKVESKLEDLKKKIEDRAAGKAGEYKAPNQLLQKAQDVNKAMKDGEKNSKEALSAMGGLKQEAEQKREELLKEKKFSDRLQKFKEQDPAADSDAGKNISDALKQQDAARAAEELEKAASKTRELLDDPGKSAEEKKNALQKLQSDLEKIAGSPALKDDPALRQKMSELADKLKELAQQNQWSAQQLSELEKKFDNAAAEMDRLSQDDDAKLNELEEAQLEDLDEVIDSLDEVMEEMAEEDQEECEGCEEGQDGQKSKSSKQGKPGKKNKSAKSGDGKKSGQKKSGVKLGKSAKQSGARKSAGAGGPNSSQNDKGDPGKGLGRGEGVGRRPENNADGEFEKKKARSEMQNGAITGISHFRGQGSKGASNPAFAEAVTAAEEDQRSSLELERIPADARDMVKDYFSKVREGANIKDGDTPKPAPDKK